MKFNKITWIVLIVGAIIAFVVIKSLDWWGSKKYNPSESLIRANLVEEQVTIRLQSVLANAQAHLKPTFKLRIDTITIKTQTNVDSLNQVLFQEASDYWHKILKDSLIAGRPDYIAQKDSIFQDSVASIKIGFHSPMPLHPKSYFILGALTVKQKETIRIYEQPYDPDLIDRFNIVVYGGPGWDPISKTYSIVTVGIGIGFNVTRIFRSR